MCIFMFNGWCMLLFFKQKTAYELRMNDWSSDVCSSVRVSAVYSLENVRYPQVDGSVCGTRAAAGTEAGFTLDCGSGLGAATHVTGAFAFAAVGRALDQLGRASCRERLCQYG